MDYKKIKRINVKKVNGRYGSDWEFRFYDYNDRNFSTLYRSDVYHYVKYLFDFFSLDERTIKLLSNGIVSIISFLKFEYNIEVTNGDF